VLWLAAIAAQEDEIRLGGGAKAAEAQHKKGRLTVRERLNLLLDAESEFLELGLWAAYGMYADYGGAPGAGVVTGMGRVAGRLCMIIANDATVKAGAFFPMTAKKVLRAQNIALENRIPRSILSILRASSFLCRRMFSRHRRFRPRLSQQRRDELAGHSPDHRHHGHVRCRRGLPPRHDRYRSHD